MIYERTIKGPENAAIKEIFFVTVELQYAN